MRIGLVLLVLTKVGLATTVMPKEMESSVPIPSFIPFREEETAAVLSRVPLEEENKMFGLSNTMTIAFNVFISMDVERVPTFPLLENVFETPMLEKTKTRIEIGTRLFKGLQSTIFRVQNRPDLLIKYQANCDPGPRRGIHPLIRDYIFLRVLEEDGIVPRVYAISSSVSLPFDLTEKTRFLLTDAERYDCVEKNGASVRYMVLSNEGSDLLRWLHYQPGHKFSIEAALHILMVLVGTLERMHSNNIIHGDIHLGNIVMKEELEIVLIDFGFARFEDEVRLGPIRRPFSYVHGLHTPWELEGLDSSYRDDMYRVLMVGAIMVTGRDYYNYCTDLLESPDSLYEFKKFGNILTIPGNDVWGDNAEVRLALEHIVDHVRGITDIKEKPDYEFIKAQLVIAKHSLGTANTREE